MSGHKGEEYRSGGKLISVVLALVAAAFAALCILQLFGGEVSYRTIKTWQLRAALTEISRNIEKEDLDMRVARLSSGGIETRIVDEQGLDLLEPQSVCENSLAEYSQQELTTLCDKDSISSGAIWEQTTRFNAPPNTGDRKKKLFWKEHEGRRIMTCANMVSLQDGSPVLVLVRSAITPSRTTTRVLRFQRLTAHQGCRIQLEKDCRVWVRADELEISRVVYNLINNAIQHAGKKKEITVIQRLQDRRVCVCVRDNGAGIREEQLSEIWNRYYRADKNQQDQLLSGSGLGLCIVREILQQHGAQYGVQSKLGEGSTFWFALDALDINK